MSESGFVTWLQNSFTKNLGLKAFAMVMALGFFGYIHSREDIRQRTIPVSVISLPPEDGGKELMTKIPATIQITLSGSTTGSPRTTWPSAG